MEVQEATVERVAAQVVLEVQVDDIQIPMVAVQVARATQMLQRVPEALQMHHLGVEVTLKVIR